MNNDICHWANTFLIKLQTYNSWDSELKHFLVNIKTRQSESLSSAQWNQSNKMPSGSIFYYHILPYQVVAFANQDAVYWLLHSSLLLFTLPHWTKVNAATHIILIFMRNISTLGNLYAIIYPPKIKKKITCIVQRINHIKE